MELVKSVHYLISLPKTRDFVAKMFVPNIKGLVKMEPVKIAKTIQEQVMIKRNAHHKIVMI